MRVVIFHEYATLAWRLDDDEMKYVEEAVSERAACLESILGPLPQPTSEQIVTNYGNWQISAAIVFENASESDWTLCKIIYPWPRYDDYFMMFVTNKKGPIIR